MSKLLDEAEKKWIKKYDCTTKSGKGYNVQDGGKIMPPKQFLLEERWYEIYKEDGWGEVQNPSSYGTAKGVANIVNFTPVRTKALKLEIVQPEKHSCGVFEWSVK